MYIFALSSCVCAATANTRNAFDISRSLILALRVFHRIIEVFAYAHNFILSIRRCPELCAERGANEAIIRAVHVKCILTAFTRIRIFKHIK